MRSALSALVVDDVALAVGDVALAGAGADERAPGPSPSAVLVPLFETGGECRVVLTLRSSGLRSHTGQVAFPGGRVDPGETLEQAALREAAEEVGLDTSRVELLGRLTPLVTVSSASLVTPVVGSVTGGRPHLTPNPAEVERVFDVAMSELMADGVHREERWDVLGEVQRPVHFFEVGGETVWGATAHVLYELLTLVVAQT